MKAAVLWSRHVPLSGNGERSAVRLDLDVLRRDTGDLHPQDRAALVREHVHRGIDSATRRTELETEGIFEDPRELSLERQQRFHGIRRESKQCHRIDLLS